MLESHLHQPPHFKAVVLKVNPYCIVRETNMATMSILTTQTGLKPHTYSASNVKWSDEGK